MQHSQIHSVIMSSLLALLPPLLDMLPALLRGTLPALLRGTLPAPLPSTQPAPLPAPLPTSLLSQRSMAFTEHWDLVLESPGFNAGSHMITHQAETIWIQKQPFISYEDVWRWVYGMENIVTCSACAKDLVAQKIRLLDTSAKFLEESSNMLKKDFIHLGLNKKSAKELRTGLNKYIKAVSFTIHFRCSF